MAQEWKYWMVYGDKNLVIWGIGETPNKAVKDAKQSYLSWNNCPEKDFLRIELSKPIRCSKKLYDFIEQAAHNLEGTEEYTWSYIDNKAELDIHINTNEACGEMRSLIDAAYDVIFMYKAETDGQKEWKKDWLEMARKHGAGLDC